MTCFFPDLSSYEAGLVLEPGTIAVIAKATEGTGYRDASYASFQAQAEHLGAVFSAYHFLRGGNGAAQADYAFTMVGPDVPLMLDVEPTGTSRPTVADCAAFIARYHALGGRVWGVYFPRWYWQSVGGDLASLGVALIASGYPTTGYSDTDSNWQAYGGKDVDVWQYTNKQPYGSRAVDFNAYRGTPAELAALITGDEVTPQDIQAIAAAVYAYGREDVNTQTGVMHNVPLGNLAHGAWVSVNDPNGPVMAALARLEAQNTALAGQVTALETQNTALTAEVTSLKTQVGTLSAPVVDEDTLAAKLVPAMVAHVKIAAV